MAKDKKETTVVAGELPAIDPKQMDAIFAIAGNRLKESLPAIPFQNKYLIPGGFKQLIEEATAIYLKSQQDAKG